MDAAPLSSVRSLPWSERLAAIGLTRGVLAVLLLWLVVCGPVVGALSAQSAPRLALTGALVDDHDIVIDGYRVGFDKAERNGHVYSDKAPGQEVLAVPAYAAARAVGADPARIDRVDANLTLWWVTLVTAGLPVVAIMAMVAVAANRRGTPIPPAALATLGFGTMLLPFGTNLYGHVLGGALAFGSWLVLEARPSSWRRALVAGALAGAAVTVEYPTAIVAVVLVAGLLVSRRWRSVGAFLAGGLPFAAALGVYQAAAFGSSFSSGYTGKEDHQGATLLITGVPRPSTFAAVLLGSRGLLLFTPVVALGAWGLWRGWRRHCDGGALTAMAAVVGFLALQSGWVTAWGGDGPGPRYVIPALPFLGLGLARAWPLTSGAVRRWVAGISITSMVVATAGEHLLDDHMVLVAGHLRQLAEDGPNPTVWSVALGPFGWVVYGASVAGALWWYRRATEAVSSTNGRSPRRGAGREVTPVRRGVAQRGSGTVPVTDGAR